MSGLAFDQVACTRGGRLLFENVSFALAGGDALVVSGPNGVGKSSLIRIAAGLLTPSAGTVTGGVARAYLAEAHALDPERTLADALLFWARIDGAGRAEVAAALAEIGLAHIANVPVRLLSTGQRRRAALAPLIAGGAPVWLLDEPASGLDVASVARLGDIIGAHRARGGALVVATHQPILLPGAQEIMLAGVTL
ncbi:MAG: heme ABC exporter ATP-binding protein CcmA [Sphingomonas sp. 28-62-20]|uniref:heme ABC exporter ATP-binding protein CcmA n=1 Tax=Sphingomonas sp. 28-62-20 TaxID=1970433 RepID=UPI000BC94F6D|nr:MAG: heme ABC exporter ATP-binding protein CcmA [Sphingomonas sp. 28-62-20]